MTAHLRFGEASLGAGRSLEGFDQVGRSRGGRRITHKTVKLAVVLAAGLCAVSGRVHADEAAPACQENKIEAASRRTQCLAQVQRDELRGGPSNTRRDCETQFDHAIAAAGTACRYIDNGDGTVSDLDTLFMWERKTTDGSVHDVGNFYSWSANSAVGARDGTAFVQFLGALNDCTDFFAAPCGFAGHWDWRLPTLTELRTIIDLGAPGCGRGAACIDPIFSPADASDYWTSSTHSLGAPAAWIVDFSNESHGTAFAFMKDRRFLVMSVRGGR
jgi:hypothetical protein